MSEEEHDKSLAALREPFAPEVVGKLPRVTCQDCSKKDRQCSKHQKQKCAVCNGYVSTSHIHLDYVGHAEVTDRLLSVDPEWSWEPLAFNEFGLPAIGRGAGGESLLWIRLTVCGVTRLGVGSVGSGAFDTEKQLIGDALRNAAMRFGVALDLWAKSELESSLPASDEGPAAASATSESTQRAVRQPPGQPTADPQTGEIVEPPSLAGESADDAYSAPIDQRTINKIKRLLNPKEIREDTDIFLMLTAILRRPVERYSQVDQSETETVYAGIEQL